MGHGATSTPTTCTCANGGQQSRRDGWAHFGYVRDARLPLGIFLDRSRAGGDPGFGDHLGEPAWQEVPGEYR
jgi:hypothetical protein